MIRVCGSALHGPDRYETVTVPTILLFCSVFVVTSSKVTLLFISVSSEILACLGRTAALSVGPRVFPTNGCIRKLISNKAGSILDSEPGRAHLVWELVIFKYESYFDKLRLLLPPGCQRSGSSKEPSEKIIL